MHRADDFIIIQFQRFFDADADEFFFYKMVKKKRILRTFAENPSDLIQFALVKKSVMKSFPSLAEKKI